MIDGASVEVQAIYSTNGTASTHATRIQANDGANTHLMHDKTSWGSASDDPIYVRAVLAFASGQDSILVRTGSRSVTGNSSVNDDCYQDTDDYLGADLDVEIQGKAPPASGQIQLDWAEVVVRLPT